MISHEQTFINYNVQEN